MDGFRSPRRLEQGIRVSLPADEEGFTGGVRCRNHDGS